MSAGTISYYLAKGIVKYHKQVQQQLKNEPQLSKQIDELVEESKKVVDELVDFEKRSVNWKKISDEITSKIPKNEIFQSTNNLNFLYKQAEKANKELIGKTIKFAQNTNGKAGFRNGLKDKARALEKINADYNGDASKLLDIAGSKVVFNSVDDLYDALKLFDKETKILKVKDRIQNPLNGYRDILTNIKMKNGHIVEFRLHLKEMEEVADGIGHKLYEEVRGIKSTAIVENRRLTLTEFNRIKKLEEESFKLYNDAWTKIINK